MCGEQRERTQRYRANSKSEIQIFAGCTTREKLVALQDADCTTVGREFDFREAVADRAEQALGEPRGHVAHAMRVGLEKRFSLIVDRAGGRLRVEVEGVVAGEVDFDGALAAAHGVQARADEIAVEKN